MKISKVFFLPAMCAATMTFATPVVAQERQVAVFYDDLNLSIESGQNTLKQRIERAVKSVCTEHGSLSLKDRMAESRCMAESRKTAMKNVEVRIAAYKANNPRVASVRVAANND